ncbi:MGH1-like glycoside hydrolase domain-containing protein [Fodinibius saliphilus]|uniref:MGH1-like glycoside hydrolase domain-containing protein n=1 Tax=Fodinibius saliphilus TaxID=1920650 RepID=UPI0011093826|nr:trehalase family glycosidase [Fodinibius saliphilus]
MKYYRLQLLLFVLLAFTLFSCDSVEVINEDKMILDYPDVLAMKGAPDSTKDDSISVFTDQGSWFGFSFTEGKTLQEKVGFSGPYHISDSWQTPSLWEGKTIAQLQLVKDSGNGQLSPVDIVSHAYPGRMQQQISYGDMEATLTLIFATDETALVRTIIKNNGNKVRTLRPVWNQTLFNDHFELIFSNGIAQLAQDGNKKSLYLTSDKPLSFDRGSNRYLIEAANSIELSPQSSDTLTLAYSYAKKEPAKIIIDAAHYFHKNKKRWSGYINDVLAASTSWNNKERLQRLSIKSIITLINNWRSPHGDLTYNGLFPSYAYQGFHGVWSWDSWKHASALALFDSELAEDQMRVMFDYQNTAGMVPDVIYADSTENNWRDTKPPLASWAVWNIYSQSGDSTFLNEMYPKLKRYHQWWYANRDHDGNGLCEYGSTDGTRIAAAWESGMDNAVRFDNAVMVKNHDHAWSLNQESVDLNAYLYADKIYLSKIADNLYLPRESATLYEEAQALKDQINEKMYDAESGYYYDKKLESEKLIPVKGPEGWIPLWAGIANKKQAATVRNIMMNKDHFRSKVPLPTLQVSHPKFNPRNGYWRGPVWLDQFYFGIKGLTSYGYNKEASVLVQELLQNAEGLTDRPAPIRENYHPMSGEGLNARHFSWSAAHILMLSQMDELEL